MIQFENTSVYGFEAAIRGMRNPMNSWDKSDSDFSCRRCEGCYYEPERHREATDSCIDIWCEKTALRIGHSDLTLMRILAKAGDDHGKFLRMINVTVDITAPRYWWTEFDTYKVGTVANSCSTMHKIHERPLSWDDFSVDERRFGDNLWLETVHGCVTVDSCFAEVIANCNHLRELFLKTNDKRYWRALIQLLPQSYNQRRTVQINYQVLGHMYFARKNHKLTEWHDFCDWALTLPYFREIVVQEG